ncbi:MAG: rRNA pseudouridine synthase [Lachnospiraceae bacterium]|nr:rRNA pseudouridine synthase [Lachnospiraceae bacterium]
MAIMALVRLDKFLANMGVGTRSEVKNLIKSKKITIDDVIVTSPDMKIDLEHNIVKASGIVVSYIEYEYYMLNKPAGVISATEDKHCSTVIDLIKDSNKKDLFPVGRLDKDTEGLLLITNDGDLAHDLLSPKKHIPKTYYAKVAGHMDAAVINVFKEGVDIGEDKPTLPAELKILNSNEVSEIELTIYEGKFHQVKRMFEAVGSKVLYLKRISMGNLQLDNSLELGEYRALTLDELKTLKEG